jgi:aryl-alcohol dehydrogenase-like predicted oxidoreductase
LVGARDARQAVENAGAIGVKLSGEEIAWINEKLYALELA